MAAAAILDLPFIHHLINHYKIWWTGYDFYLEHTYDIENAYFVNI